MMMMIFSKPLPGYVYFACQLNGKIKRDFRFSSFSLQLYCLQFYLYFCLCALHESKLSLAGRHASKFTLVRQPPHSLCVCYFFAFAFSFSFFPQKGLNHQWSRSSDLAWRPVVLIAGQISHQAARQLPRLYDTHIAHIAHIQHMWHMCAMELVWYGMLCYIICLCRYCKYCKSAINQRECGLYYIHVIIGQHYLFIGQPYARFYQANSSVLLSHDDQRQAYYFHLSPIYYDYHTIDINDDYTRVLSDCA